MTEPAREPVTVIVVAGGASRRMGRPKLSLLLGDETLLARVVRLVAPAGSEVVVAAAPGLPCPALPVGVRVVEDETPGLGPLAGLVEGLRSARHDLAFVCGADHAFPSAALAGHLIALARDRDLVVPRWRGRLQPLFAAWHRRLLPRLEAFLAGRRLGLVAAAEALQPLEVPDADIARFDPDGLSFLDLDEPADYERALARLRRE